MQPRDFKSVVSSAAACQFAARTQQPPTPIVPNRHSLVVRIAGDLSVAAACVAVAFQPLVVHADTGKPAIGTWGFDLAAISRSIAPGDDFFRYTGGVWMRTTKIPPDRAQWGSLNILRAKSEGDVRTVIEAAAPISGNRDSACPIATTT
jgi:hypothetical protein